MLHNPRAPNASSEETDQTLLQTRVGLSAMLACAIS